MTGRWAKRGALLLLIVIVLTSSGLFYLLGTESGTRWLLSRAEPYLPPELQLQRVGGTLLSTLSIQTLTWRDDSSDVDIASLTVGVELVPLLRKHVKLTMLTAQSVNVGLKSNDAAPNNEPFSFRLPLRISVELAEINNIRVTRETQTVLLDDVLLSGTASDNRVELDHLKIDSNWLQVEGRLNAELTPPYQSAASLDWYLSDLVATELSGRLIVDGNGDSDAGYNVDHTLILPLALESEGKLWFENGEIRADLENKWTDLEWPINEQQRVHSANGVLNIVGTATSYEIAGNADVRVNSWPAATVDVAGSGDLGHINLAQLSAVSELANIDVSGLVDWSEDPHWQLDYTVSDLQLAQLQSAAQWSLSNGSLKNGSLNAAGSTSGTRLVDGTLQQKTVIGIGNNRVEIEGQLLPSIDLALAWDAPALDQILAALTGGSEGSVKFRSDDDGWMASGRASASEAKWNDNSVGLLIFSGDIGTAGESDASVDIQRLHFNARDIDTAELKLVGTMREHVLELAIKANERQALANVFGGLQDRQWDGRLDYLHLIDGDRSEWTLVSAVPARISEQGVRIDTLCLSETSLNSRLCADATLTDKQLRADAELQIVDYGVATAYVDIADIFSSQSVIDGKAALDLTDLSFIPKFLPALSATQGEVNGELAVAGRLDDITLGGQLALENGAFTGNAAGIAVSDISLQLRQQANGRLSLSGTANSGEGQVAITGESMFDPSIGLATTINITGENFEFVRLPEWQAVASPQIDVTLDDGSARVRGRLDIAKAKVTLNTLPETAERVSPDATVHGRESGAVSGTRLFDLDVEASLGDDVELSGFGLNTKLSGALRLRGSTQEPFIGTGRIELRDGRYEAYGQELTIENGALVFSGSLTNPTLDIRAVRQVDDVLAGVNLRGTPENLSSTVFSDPVLSDAEALSYLIAGRPLASTDNQDSSRVGQAAFALGLTGADKVIAEVQSKLGLDSLSLDSSDDVGRIVAGRRIGGRLLVEYGYGLVDRLGTLLLRYQLSERLIVETTTGTASSLDLVYSVKKD